VFAFQTSQLERLQMNELWLIAALVFVSVILGVEALYWLIVGSWRTEKSINRRLMMSKKFAEPTGILTALRAERSFFDSKNALLRRINDRFSQTGLRPDRSILLLSIATLGAASFVVWTLVLGAGLTAAGASILSALGLIAFFFEIVRQKRIARFTELLPDAIDVIIRGVRVGFPLPVALDLAAREMPDPIGTEFGMTSDEITFGQDVRTAIENLYRRVGHEDLLFFVVAINVQNQTGGNLAEVLSRLSRLLRSRSKLRLKIRSLSAEGRVSAIVLSLMPFILFAGIALISPGYFAEIRNEGIVMPALIYGAISLLLGNIVMNRMVHFKF
jgi:tight adherence protein B